MAKRKEIAFSAKQIEQLHVALETHAAEQAGRSPARDLPLPRVPRFKRIQQYTTDELNAAISAAAEQECATQFWRLVNGVDAFFERRRRERGWGLSLTTRGTPANKWR